MQFNPYQRRNRKSKLELNRCTSAVANPTISIIRAERACGPKKEDLGFIYSAIYVYVSHTREGPCRPDACCHELIYLDIASQAGRVRGLRVFAIGASCRPCCTARCGRKIIFSCNMCIYYIIWGKCKESHCLALVGRMARDDRGECVWVKIRGHLPQINSCLCAFGLSQGTNHRPYVTQ